MPRYIIGVHSGHDSSACLLKDNIVKYAIQKERLSRKKHDSGEPKECIEYLLEAEGISASQVSLLVKCDWHDANYLDNQYYQKFPRVIRNLNHHLFHAWSISSMISFNERVLIWVVDGRGCRPQDAGITGPFDKNLYEAESVYLAESGYLTCIEKRFAEHKKKAYTFGSHMDSIGYAYSHVAKLIFKSSHDAGKVMALASYGADNPEIPPVLNPPGSNKVINDSWLNFLNTLPHLNWDTRLAKDLSFKIQEALENYAAMRLDGVIRKHKCSHVAICGGVGLNCKNNGAIANLAAISKLSLFPACDDSGLAIGAAIWGSRAVFGDLSAISFSPFLGRKYASNYLDPNLIKRVAQLLDAGQLVAIFENESEYGPRALGHRSILCKATDIKFKNILNRKIKHRETFRPFGGVILSVNLSRITHDIVSSDYMLSAIRVREEVKYNYPALVHRDGTLRLQISRDPSSVISKILVQYENISGKILLINTSFNGKDEPIVETPEEAISCAKNNSIPYLLCRGELIEIDN